MISRGLGEEVTKKLVAQNASVIGIDIIPSESSILSDSNFIVCDISNPKDIINAIKSATDSLGGLDLLINNAGSLNLQDVADLPTETSKQCFNVNFWGTWNTTSAALPYLINSKGKVVNISSLFGCVNAPLIPAYSASKRAVAALSDSLRIQYGDQVKITTVYPGFIDTKIHTDAVRQGLSVKKILDIRFFGFKPLDLEESIENAAKGVINACKSNKRDVGSTFLGSLTFWFARHLPTLVDFIIKTRVNYLLKSGTLSIELDKIERVTSNS